MLHIAAPIHTLTGAALGGLQLGKFSFPKTQHGSRQAAQVGHLADAKVKFFRNHDRRTGAVPIAARGGRSRPPGSFRQPARGTIAGSGHLWKLRRDSKSAHPERQYAMREIFSAPANDATCGRARSGLSRSRSQAIRKASKKEA